jgi:hypothetical protein
VNEERDGSSAEFFDEEMAEKVIVLGEVAHVHYFCRTPEHGPGGVGERSHGGRREKERIRRGDKGSASLYSRLATASTSKL